ncbi:MAG: dehydratase [Actinobacteria bacterium]|nr:dehydratase [Actinomycetota bacterium]
MSDLTPGTELPTISQTSNLVTSVMYAGASGDMNPLHYDESFASNVSPTGGIIAHGMYSMGLASRLLTEWAGGPDRVLAVEVRFTKPWPVNSTTTFGGTVLSVEDGVATVELWADNVGGDRVLSGTGRVRA